MTTEADEIVTTLSEEIAASEHDHPWDGDPYDDNWMIDVPRSLGRRIKALIEQQAREIASLKRAAEVRDETVKALTGTVTNQQFEIARLKAEAGGAAETEIQRGLRRQDAFNVWWSIYLSQGGEITAGDVYKAWVAACNHERDAASPSPPSMPGEGWQDISTAPKTCARTLIAKPFIGYCPDLEDPITICWWEPKVRGGSWAREGDTTDFEAKPTHWMPLPSPPVSKTEGDLHADGNSAATVEKVNQSE